MISTERASSLYVKSFFAASIPEAMEEARRELGSEALLLNSREAPPEARHLGDYEVVFGAWPGTAAPSQPAAPAAVPLAPPSEIDELHQRMGELEAMIARLAPSPARTPVAECSVAQALIDAGVEIELARDIESAVRKRLGKSTVLEIGRPRQTPDHEPVSWLAATADEIAQRFEVQPEIGRITALVGPPGSGKTTTLVKLAINQCLSLGRPVRLISTDTLRIGGAEQLRTYAGILGVPFQAAESTVALAQAIDSTPPNTWVLIDTPGLSAALQQDLGGELAQFLSHRQDIDTHLILTASMERSDLRCVTDRFQDFSPKKLLFTRLDETSSAASMFSEAARTQKPLSFFSHGQSVPEDFRPATKDQIIDSLVRQLPDALQAVA